MNKRGTGVMFCLISTLLYCTRLISAALMSGSVMVGDAGVYSALKSYVGYEVLILSGISLIVGIMYLYSADIRKTNKDA